MDQKSKDEETPLCNAVSDGNLDAVKALLELGSNANIESSDGITPDKEFDEADDEEDEDEFYQPPDFSEAAETDEFKTIIRQVADWTGCEPKPAWDDYLENEEENFSGCVRFILPSDRADSILAKHHRQLRNQGAYLFKCYQGNTSREDHLMLLPTGKWETVLEAMDTNGCNCGIYNDDVIEWLKKLEQRQPFELTGAGVDWCEGRFTEPIRNSRTLAKQMYEFCPDIVDQGVGSVAGLAINLQKTQEFFFWWD